MLIVDINTLQSVNSLYLADHVILYSLDTLESENVVRVDTADSKRITGFNVGAVLDLDILIIRDGYGLGRTILAADDNFLLLLGDLARNSTADLSNDRLALWLSGLEKLLYSRKTLCDITAGYAARMECTHGKLCTRLTDGLRRNNADSLTDLYSLTGCQVLAVALRADTHVGTAGKCGTNLDSRDIRSDNHIRTLRRNHMICLDDYLAGLRIDDILCRIAAADTFLQRLDLLDRDQHQALNAGCLNLLCLLR